MNFAEEMQMKLNETTGLTERERKFLVAMISKAVYQLKDYENRINNVEIKLEDSTMELNRSLGYLYAQRNVTNEIIGSSLSDFFGGMGIDSRMALENLAKRENIHPFCPIIVDEYYEELLKIWDN